MKQPNDRQKALAKYMAEHSGISLNQAMKDMDYSEAYAHNSHQLKKTKTWRYLMRHVLPNSKLVKVVDEGLGAMRVISAMNTGKQASGATSDFIEVPDHAVRHKFVETALKMKGKLVDKVDHTTNGKDLVINVVSFKDGDNLSEPVSTEELPA